MKYCVHVVSPDTSGTALNARFTVVSLAVSSQVYFDLYGSQSFSLCKLSSIVLQLSGAWLGRD